MKGEEREDNNENFVANLGTQRGRRKREEIFKTLEDSSELIDYQQKPRPKSDFSIALLENSTENPYFARFSKRKLINAITSARKEIITLKGDFPRKGISHSVKTERNTKSDSLKLLQKQNLLKIRQNEKEQEKVAYKLYKDSVGKSRTPNQSERKRSENTQSSVRFEELRMFLSEKERNEDEHTEVLLESLHRRLNKSLENHQKYLDKRKKVVLEHWERAKSVNQQRVYSKNVETKLMKIISKNNEFEFRKDQYLKELHDKIARRKRFKEDQIVKAKNSLSGREQKAVLKTRELEKRMQALDGVVKNRRMELKKELEEKSERNKVKTIDASYKFKQNLEKQ
jgi:hypothetical protein